MKILQVKKYNAIQTAKYNNAVRDWQPTKGGFPFIGLYAFMHNGNYRKTGYVAFDEHKAILRPTKHQAIEAFFPDGGNK